MFVTGIKTKRISSGSVSLLALLDEAIPELNEGSVVAITSKIVSLCQGNTVSFGSIPKDELLAREADLYLPKAFSKYGYHFSIKNHTIISMAGIDESNGGEHYVLWPKDAQSTANQVREYLKRRFGLTDVGILITDSACRPLRRGASGIMLAHSGFAALNNYIGQPDLFGRPFSVSQADIAGGLAASAVLQMGEGSEQTPIAILTDLPSVRFQDRNPTPEELREIHVSLEDDLFAPFLTSADWQRGANAAI